MYEKKCIKKHFFVYLVDGELWNYVLKGTNSWEGFIIECGTEIWTSIKKEYQFSNTQYFQQLLFKLNILNILLLGVPK